MRKSLIAAILLAVSISTAPATYSIPYIAKKDFKCLVENIYHEARGESFRGQVLVGKTTLARLEHPAYPDTICKVVYQPKQFSWTATKNKAIKDAQALARATEAAWHALQDKTEHAPLFFHATYVKPSWAKTKQLLVKEGNHVFYGS